MKNSLKIAALGLVALTMGFVSCEDAEYDVLGVHAFVSESAANKNMKVTITSAGAEAEITACLSEAATQDTKLRFVIDTVALQTYNTKQSTSYVALPTDQFEMAQEVVIPAGAYSAPATKIHILPLKEEYVGETYALPLRLESVDGSVPVTSTTSSIVITTESITISTLPKWVGRTGLTAEGFPVSLPQFTIEVQFQVSNTSNRNRDIFLNGGSVLLRFEDPQNDNADFQAHSLIQFQGEGWYLNPKFAITPNKWQHYALTYDGTKVAIYVNGALAGTKEGICDPKFNTCGWFGGGDAGGGHGTSDPQWWRGCQILLKEARLWSVCRSEAQIANNMSTTSAKSNGLVGYWRMDQASTEVDSEGVARFKDYSGNGHTLVTGRPFEWIPNVSSVDVSTPWK